MQIDEAIRAARYAIRKKLEIIITQQEVDSVWGRADFGKISRMDVVKYALLKAAGGYYQGHTSRQILIELKLIKSTKKGQVLTSRGRENLFEFFKDDKKNI